MARYLSFGMLLTVLAACSAIPAGAADGSGRELVEEPAARRSSDKEGVVDRNRVDPAFTEFLEAMQRIKSRYAKERERIEEAEKRKRDREWVASHGAAPAADRRYGLEFSELPLREKLALMKEDAKADMQKRMTEHAQRMKEYEKELEEKSRRFDKALPGFPSSLVKSGEPPDLADAFGKEWLRLGDLSSDRAFYHRGLMDAYFTSEIPADQVERFLWEAYREFKEPHRAR